MHFNLADLFECVARTVPEREAVVWGERRLTYAALDERATRMGHALAGAGVGPGDAVGLYLHDAPEYLEAMLACFKIRAVPLNVNFRYVADELAYLCADAGVVALVHDAAVAAHVAAARATLPALHTTIETGRAYESLLAGTSSVRDFPPRSPDDRYVLYTGGTTGRPKGVVWRQEDIFFAALGGGNPGGPPIERPGDIAASVLTERAPRIRPYLAPGERQPDEFTAMALGPLMHAGGQWLALGTLLGGGRVVLRTDMHVDMLHVLDLVARERITMLSLVGDASGLPLADALEAHPARWDTSALLLLGSGGAMLSATVKARLMAALPSVLAILEAIGSSEAPVQATTVTARDGAPAPSLHFAPREQTIVVDDDLHPVAAGSGRVGRLATRGRTPVGYHNDAARTAATFVEIDGARWSLPGDMATVEADGTIRLLGRGALCINTGGEKVYPEEIEAVVKAHPAVADAVVVGAPDARWGQRVVAVIAVADAADPPALADVQAHCRARLAGYKVPRALHVVARIERSPAGKADYEWAAALVRAASGAGATG